MRAQERRRIKDHNDRAWLAFQIASLQREKKLTKSLYHQLLAKPQRRVRQTVEEQKRIVRLMAGLPG